MQIAVGIFRIIFKMKRQKPRIKRKKTKKKDEKKKIANRSETIFVTNHTCIIIPVHFSEQTVLNFIKIAS